MSTHTGAPASGCRPPWTAPTALLAPALAAGLGLARLTRTPGAPDVWLPVLSTVLAGHLTAVVLRRRAGLAAGLAAGIVAVSLSSLWSVAPSATTWGVPTASTFHVVHRLVSQAWHVTTVTPTPVPAVQGVVLWMALGAGTAAVVGACLVGSGRRGAPVWPALVPSAALFAYASLFSSGSGRGPAAAAYVAGVTLFALSGNGGMVTLPGRRATAVRAGAWGAATLIVGVGAALPLVLAPSFSAMRLSAFPAAPSQIASGTVGGQFPGTVLEGSFLVDNLGAVLGSAPDALLFVAHTPVPTYWQVATLTTFDGTRWLPDPETAALVEGTRLAGGAPPSLPQPVPRATFRASLQFANLQSELLPVPPGTLSVTGIGGSSTAKDGLGVYLPNGSPFGSTYEVVAAAPEPVLAADATTTSGPEVASYLELPPLPQDVVTLAHEIVGSATNPLTKALALTGFFQGNGFRFSLDVNQGGADPLETFLFGSRVGFCQQFAGAFAVLARADRLPTRLAVGFTAGAPGPGDTFEVTRADAHVWPQVYLGAHLGWVSFEPTPSTGDAFRPLGVLSSTAPAGQSGSAASSGQTFHPLVGSRTRTALPTAAKQTPSGSGRGTRGGAGRGWWLVAVVTGILLLIAWAGRRRFIGALHVVPARHLPPRRAVVAHWRRAERVLGRRQLGRRPDETMAEHACRVAAHMEGAAGAYRALSDMAARAGYSAEAMSPADASAARALRHQVVHPTRRRRRVDSR